MKKIIFVFSINFLFLYLIVSNLNNENLNKYSLNRNFYLSGTNRDDVDHSYIFHNINNIIEYIQKADILTLGNSKMLVALDHDSINNFNSLSNKKIFNLSFDHAEGIMFPLSIIKKHKIKPKVLIVHVGPYMFFSEQISEPAKLALSNNKWHSVKNFIEFNLNTKSQDLLHTFLPKFKIWSKYNIRRYRSKINGCIEYSTSNKSAHNFNWEIKEKQSIYKKIENAVLSLNSFCKSNEIKLILTQVPSPEINPFTLIELSRLTGINSIEIPRSQNFSTFDHSHLDKKSSKIFTEEFLRSLDLEIIPSI